MKPPLLAVLVVIRWQVVGRSGITKQISAFPPGVKPGPAVICIKVKSAGGKQLGLIVIFWFAGMSAQAGCGVEVAPGVGGPGGELVAVGAGGVTTVGVEDTAVGWRYFFLYRNVPS